MTTNIYPSALAALRDEVIDWTAHDIRAVLLGPNFVYDPSAVNVDELPAAHVIESSLPIENRSYIDGLAAGGVAAFIQLLDNRRIENVVLYQDVGDPVYSPLLVHYDVNSIIGAPKVASGEDEFVFSLSPPGGYFLFTDTELLGTINSYLLAGNFALLELSGGITLVLPSVLINEGLRVSTHKVCVPAPERDTCCEPVIRSSRCE